MNDLPYRDAVGIMLLNRDNQVFVAKRIDMKAEAWQMPQGGMDKGETPEQALWRELMEETGTDKAEILHRLDGYFFYDLPPELIPKVWNGKYRGQRQTWFALRFTGNDGDINIATAEPEFSEWQWVAMHRLPELIVPFKRELYQTLVERFREVL